jgi:acyl carrier protein
LSFSCSFHVELADIIAFTGNKKSSVLENKTHFAKRIKKVGTDEVDVEAIEKKVIKIISDQLGADKSEITREVSFINDLSADSLDIVELVMEFEDEFDMNIPDEEAEKIQTVGAAVDYVVNLIKSKSKE